MTLDLAACWGFALLALRTAGLAVTVPVISARVVPARVRLALALLVAWAAWTAAGMPGARAPALTIGFPRSPGSGGPSCGTDLGRSV